MVNLKTKKIRGNDYYYLVYNFRDGNKIRSIEKEIGKEIPENIEEIKENFIAKIVDKRWIKKVEEVRELYNRKIENLSSFVKARHIKDFGIRFTHNTNKIEGSTLTLLEVNLAINEMGVSINKPTDDIVEAKLHMQCYEDMVNKTDKVELTKELILKWHKTLFSLHPNYNNFAGLIRRGQIYIQGINYVSPAGGIACETLLDQLFTWYFEKNKSLHPVLLACLMHYRFLSIHPFDDGNGRMSRLLMNFILFKNHYPMFDIPAQIRKSYYKILERANLKEDEMSFVGWFFKHYVKSIKELRLPS
jgi:Fic family protein